MDSNKLKGLRVSLGYTQEQMATKLEVAVKTYNRKEQGLVDFTRGEISKIAEILNMSLQSVNEVFFAKKLTD